LKNLKGSTITLAALEGVEELTCPPKLPSF